MTYVLENNTYIGDDRSTVCDTYRTRAEAIKGISRIIEEFVKAHRTDFALSVQPPDGISPGSMVITNGDTMQLVVAEPEHN